MRRPNPGLWIVSNPPKGESKAWEEVFTQAKRALRMIPAAQRTSAVVGNLRAIEEVALRMLRQVAEGVHTNPGTPRGGTKFSNHVEAVVYRHVTEGPRAHGFGNAELDERDLEHGILRLDDVKEKTNVAMYAMPDGTVMLKHSQGKPLWREDR